MNARKSLCPSNRGSLMLLVLAINVGLAAACQKKEVVDEKTPPSAAPPVAQNKGPEKAVAADSAEPKGAWKAPQWDDKTLCGSSCLLLMNNSFEQVQKEIYCKKCQPFDESACELDWPTSDVPACSFYDEMRNCIYAGYGRPFENEQWQKAFGGQSWYKPDPAYSDERLSVVAMANVATLLKMVAGGSCIK